MHAGDALWDLYGLVTALERSAGSNAEMLKLLAGARNNLKVIGDFISVPAPNEVELAPRVPKITPAYVSSPPPSSVGSESPKSRVVLPHDDVQRALDLCDAIIRDVDEMPEEAEDFAESILDKAKSMRDNIQKHDSVTEKMLSALENMRHGQERWLSQ